MQELKGKSFRQLSDYSASLSTTIKFIENIPSHLRTIAQRDTLKDLRASRIQVRRAMNAHPDKPKQMEMFPFPIK